MNRRWLTSLSYSYSEEHGHQNDPYKIISIVDRASGQPNEQIYENRPDLRRKQSIFFDNKIHLLSDVISASLRGFKDAVGQHHIARSKTAEQLAEQSIFARAFTLVGSHRHVEHRPVGERHDCDKARDRKSGSFFLAPMLRKLRLILRRIRHQRGRAIGQLHVPTAPQPALWRIFVHHDPGPSRQFAYQINRQSLSRLTVPPGIRTDRVRPLPAAALRASPTAQARSSS